MVREGKRLVLIHCVCVCTRKRVYKVCVCESLLSVCVCVCRLNLRELGPLASHMRWFVWLMAAAGTIYVFNYHEKCDL